MFRKESISFKKKIIPLNCLKYVYLCHCVKPETSDVSRKKITSFINDMYYLKIRKNTS